MPENNLNVNLKSISVPEFVNTSTSDITNQPSPPKSNPSFTRVVQHYSGSGVLNQLQRLKVSNFQPTVFSTKPLPIAIEEPPATTVYNEEGSLNSDVFSSVLQEILTTLATLRAKYETTQDKKLNDDLTWEVNNELINLGINAETLKSKKPHDSYEQLKSVAAKLKLKSKSSKNKDYAYKLIRLSQVIRCMARTDFNQRSMPIYDRESQRIATQYDEAQPNFQNINSAIVTTKKISVGFSGGFGVGASLAGGGNASLYGNVGYQTDYTISVDDDQDFLLQETHTFDAGLGFIVKMKLPASIKLATVSTGSRGAKKTGTLIDTKTLQQSIAYSILAERESLLTTASYRLTSPNGINRHIFLSSNEGALDSSAFAISKSQVRTATKKATSKRGKSNNCNTTSAIKKLKNKIKQPYKFLASIGGVSRQDQDFNLNLTKLAKGDNADVLIALLSDIPEFAKLTDTCKSAYAQLHHPKLVSNDPIVLEGYWQEISLGFAAGGEAGLLWNLTSDATDYLKNNQAGFSGSAGVNVEASFRRMPIRLWNTPHEIIEKSTGGRLDEKASVLAETLILHPAHAKYVETFGIGEPDPDHDPSQDKKNIAALKEDSKLFQSNVKALLQARALMESNDDKNGGPIYEWARNSFNQAMKNLLTRFGPGTLDSSEAYEATNVFKPLSGHKLSKNSDDKKTLSATENLAAFAWNSLSLGMAQARLYCTDERFDKDWLAISDEIKNPNIPYLPLTHLYNRSVFPGDGELTRYQVAGSFKLKLSAQLLGDGISVAPNLLPAADVSALLTNSITVGFVHKEIHGHPNFARNGKFLALTLQSEGLLAALVNPLTQKFVVSQLVHQLFGDKNFETPHLDTNSKASVAESLTTSLSAVLEQITTTASRSGSSGFTIVLHKGLGDSSLKPQYIQLNTTKVKGVSVSPNISAYVGGGGAASISVSTSQTIVSAEIPALGSDPAIHMLQFPNWKDSYKDVNGQYELTPEAIADAPLRHKLEQKYFMGNSLIGVVKKLATLKQLGRGESKTNEAGFLGRLAMMSFNLKTLENYRTAGLSHLDLQQALEKAQDATQEMSPKDRMLYFAEDPNGKAVLSEYLRGITIASEMKGKAYFQLAPGNEPVHFHGLVASKRKIEKDLRAKEVIVKEKQLGTSRETEKFETTYF